jgi:hypothetical protein
MEFWRSRHGILEECTRNFGGIDMEFWRSKHEILEE